MVAVVVCVVVAVVVVASVVVEFVRCATHTRATVTCDDETAWPPVAIEGGDPLSDAAMRPMSLELRFPSKQTTAMTEPDSQVTDVITTG